MAKITLFDRFEKNITLIDRLVVKITLIDGLILKIKLIDLLAVKITLIDLLRDGRDYSYQKVDKIDYFHLLIGQWERLPLSVG